MVEGEEAMLQDLVSKESEHLLVQLFVLSETLWVPTSKIPFIHCDALQHVPNLWLDRSNTQFLMDNSGHVVTHSLKNSVSTSIR